VSHLAIVVKAPQELSAAEWRAICDEAYSFRHTVTASEDDMLTVLRGGNAESYVKVAFPARPSQQRSIAALDAAGYRWQQFAHFDDRPRPQLMYRPCQTTRITQLFGVNPANYPGLPGHDGLDYGVQMGHAFHAAQTGVCVHASDRRWSDGNPSAYGWHVVLDHGDYCTVYGHARQDLRFSVGDVVPAGAIVGVSGNTGNSSGYHLHFGLLDKTGMIDAGNGFPLWRFGRAIDPLPSVEGLRAP
jgi:murein DD-endopeptidase MepM/ murein hydrolase activator NlpD